MTLLRGAGKPRYAYWLAVVLPLAFFLAATAGAAVIGPTANFAITYAGIALVALYGGFVPGLVATGCTTVLELADRFGNASLTPALPSLDPVEIGFFVAGGVLASLAAGSLQDARARAGRARREEGAARVEAERAAARSVALAELSAESRARAEASRQRLDLLADAGRILGASLDFSTTLPALARLTVPLLGDLCVIEVLGGETRRIVVAGETQERSAAAALSDPASLLGGDGEIGRAVRDNRSVVLDLVSPGEEGASGKAIRSSGTPADEPLRSALLGIGVRQLMVVPIRVRDTPLGAFFFGTTEVGRAYEGTDLSTAEVLAQRAAKAIDNGRLHLEIQRLAFHEQERAAELESVVGAIGEGIVVCGPEGQVRVTNTAAERMLGGVVADQDALAQRLALHQERLPPPGVQFGPAEFQLADRRGAWIELTAYPVLPHRASTPGVVRVSAPPDGAADTGQASGQALQDTGGGVRAATVYVLRDVSAFRQGQRLREAFMGLLSHELRTPVTTIYAAANVLGRPSSSLSSETRQEILSDMIGEADRLYRLVEDLMVLARFDEGIDLARDPNLLQHLVPAVIDTERGRWPQVSFALERDPGLPAVNGDETSIQQVLRNLLSNAAKYSPAGSTVTVRVEAEDDGVSVRVLDEGPGVQPAEAEDLFDPFYRSPATAAMANGAGIGLYVSRRLTDAMGGRIWAASRPTGGSAFSFWLPRYFGPPGDAGGDAPTGIALPQTRSHGPTGGGSRDLDTHL